MKILALILALSLGFVNAASACTTVGGCATGSSTSSGTKGDGK